MQYWIRDFLLKSMMFDSFDVQRLTQRRDCMGSLLRDLKAPKYRLAISVRLLPTSLVFCAIQLSYSFLIIDRSSAGFY